MRINTNVASLTAMEANSANNISLGQSLEKLSTGLSINKASDNASGLAIADKLRTQASSLTQAIANGNSAITLTQIADKAMAEQSNIIDIIKTKLIQASTATTTTAGINAIRADIVKLAEQLDNIAKTTNYNGMTLLQDTSSSNAIASVRQFQMGEFSGDVITVGGTSIGDGGVQANLAGLSIIATSANDISIANNAAASAMLATMDTALTSLNTMRSEFGSAQNRIESSVRNLSTTVTNLKTAESVIRDVDYASESANFNKLNVISQAGTYAISQANQVQQNVLRLLQ
ncbi:MAG: flagellin [Campylobacterota bacterium]|nr:flagellin [Campylobacterota bacterium]